MKIPTLYEAQSYMTEAKALNPGPWVQHSINAAEAARAIAKHHPALDPEMAYIFGYIHDIGRREGVTQLRHIVDGYKFLQERGFDDAAQICMTHSFPSKDVLSFQGKWDCTDEEIEFIKSYLANVQYTEYDRLIQLCDALAMPNGICVIEKRFVDVVLRHGISEYTLPRWRAYLKIKRDFERTIGISIYSLLPNVIEGTFGFNPCEMDNAIPPSVRERQ